uniref:Gustatory receptor n=1 Tax=Stomoxys calcitrans TaxID=35570 RepID=A0A454A0P8_STOCA
MSTYPELYLHIKTLNILGLVCCDCLQDASKRLDIDCCSSHERKAKTKLFIVLLTCFSTLIYCCICIQDFHIGIFNEIGNHHLILVFACSSLMISCFYVYFYATRSRNIAFLKDIFHYYNDICEQGEASAKSCRRQYFLYAQISLLSLLVCISSFVQAVEMWTAKVSLIVIHFSFTMVVGVIISLYVSIVRMIMLTMKHLNAQLCDCTNKGYDCANLRNLQHIIERRNRLLVICYKDLNRRFGLMLLLTFAYIILMAPSGPYLIIVRLLRLHIDKDVWTIILPTVVSSFWSIPWIVIFAMMSKCGGLTTE